ncbi:hypothetical protein CAC42_4194 [Sphaceloma murrayae]|uniref:Protein HRI1 n=1 Tax=Sphaceloma murrayae TaxID=2082308 RepID=A0A2K1QLA9_9PEZI|nr:hypothetical protein CAC42_4194 [Sphaceloma murrayae]
MATSHEAIPEPFISWREYIHWTPGEPSEPTSTLVLTSRQRRFIDIRINKPKAGEPELPNEGDPPSRLQWAFAGVSKATLLPDSSTINVPGPVQHCVWTHWVDSHAPPFHDTDVRDEGDLFSQPDGSSLEVGEMRNPETGKVQKYEEKWVDEEVERTGAEEGRRAVVLELSERDEEGREWAKGAVVRVGRWVQGLVKVVRGAGAEISCERWKWEEGGWERVMKIGRLWLPCKVACEEAVEVGKEVRYGEWRWVVKEVDIW